MASEQTENYLKGSVTVTRITDPREVIEHVYPTMPAYLVPYAIKSLERSLPTMGIDALFRPGFLMAAQALMMSDMEKGPPDRWIEAEVNYWRATHMKGLEGLITSTQEGIADDGR